MFCVVYNWLYLVVFVSPHVSPYGGERRGHIITKDFELIIKNLHKHLPLLYEIKQVAMFHIPRPMGCRSMPKVVLSYDHCSSCGKLCSGRSIALYVRYRIVSLYNVDHEHMNTLKNWWVGVGVGVEVGVGGRCECCEAVFYNLWRIRGLFISWFVACRVDSLLKSTQ